LPAKRKIIVAPLNWGLGHASRCVPLIRMLMKQGFEVLLASDGDALQLLQLEFPELTSFELPSYNMSMDIILLSVC
jgi:UDP:flavonoid glycosyltransferase YjiC (YdhE family)